MTEVALEVADALVAAHRVAVVHGDLTAEVVLLTDDGQVIVTGFGRAYALGGPVKDLAAMSDGGAEHPSTIGDLQALGALVSSTLGDRPVPDGLQPVLARLRAVGSVEGYRSAGEVQADLDLLVNGERLVPVPGHDDPVDGGDRPGIIASLPVIGKVLLGVLGLGAVLTLAFFAAGRLGFRLDHLRRPASPMSPA